MTDGTLTHKLSQQVYEAVPHLPRLPSGKIWINCDQEAEVLYLSLGRPSKLPTRSMRRMKGSC